MLPLPLPPAPPPPQPNVQMCTWSHCEGCVQDYKPNARDWLSSYWKGFMSPDQMARIRNTGVPMDFLKEVPLTSRGFPVHRCNCFRTCQGLHVIHTRGTFCITCSALPVMLAKGNLILAKGNLILAKGNLILAKGNLILAKGNLILAKLEQQGQLYLTPGL